MITIIIIIITAVISFLAFESPGLKSRMLFNPYLINHGRQWYRFISGGLIHEDWMHLFFNMYSLYLFGTWAERDSAFFFGENGALFYVFLYISAIPMASFFSFEKNKNNIHYNALGASGAVSAVIFSFIVFNPKQPLGLLFLPIPIPAFVYGFIFLGVEYYLGKRGRSNIGHDAHFWGAVYGFLLTVVLKPSLIVQFFDQLIYYRDNF